MPRTFPGQKAPRTFPGQSAPRALISSRQGGELGGSKIIKRFFRTLTKTLDKNSYSGLYEIYPSGVNNKLYFLLI